MKKIVMILRSLNGVFAFDRPYSDNPILVDIYRSVKGLEYYSCENDKKNMQSDISKVVNDFQKSKLEAKSMLNKKKNG